MEFKRIRDIKEEDKLNIREEDKIRLGLAGGKGSGIPIYPTKVPIIPTNFPNTPQKTM